MGKTFRAKVRDGRLEPLEPVELKEGDELEVTVAEKANEWFKELHALFAPVRKEFAKESEATIDRRIARAVKTVRARGQKPLFSFLGQLIKSKSKNETW